MTLAMDVRLASEQARFGLVFSKLGVVDAACSIWFLFESCWVSLGSPWGLPEAMECEFNLGYLTVPLEGGGLGMSKMIQTRTRLINGLIGDT